MFEQLTLKKYTEILASNAPTPGGGSALAVVASIACSLVEMSINVTNTKTPAEQWQSHANFFAKARQKFLRLSDEDAQAFRHILDCMHMPKDTQDQQLARQRELQKAYHRAALVPLDVMNACINALMRARLILKEVYAYVASDCVIGIDLLRQAAENSAENVYANTCLIKDEQLRNSLENQAKQALSQVKAQ